MEDNNYIPVEKNPTIISTIGAIPKRDGTIRLIQDCSLPTGQSLYDFASKDPCVYQSIQDVIYLLKPHCYMAKVVFPFFISIHTVRDCTSRSEVSL